MKDVHLLIGMEVAVVDYSEVFSINFVNHCRVFGCCMGLKWLLLGGEYY